METADLLRYRLEKLEKRNKQLWFTAISILGLGLIGIINYAFTIKEKPIGILRAKGIIIEDSLGRDRILIGAPIPSSKHRVRTDTNKVRRYWASKFQKPDEYMGWYKNYRHSAIGMVVMNEQGFDIVQIGDKLSDANMGRRMFDNSGILWNDNNGYEKGGAGVNTLEDGTSRTGVGLDGADGAEAVHMMAFEDGTNALIISGKNGRLMVGMSVKDGLFQNKTDFTGIKYFNNEGQLLWEQEMNVKPK